MTAKKQKRGRPMKDATDVKSESVLLRMESREKQAFTDAARVAGAPMSVWIRERLRQAAVRELEAASRPIPFLE